MVFCEGTTLSGQIGDIDSHSDQEPISYDFYYIVPDKCTEVRFHEELQCAAVCPVECCVPDEDNVESKEDLLTKKPFFIVNNLIKYLLYIFLSFTCISQAQKMMI